MRLQQWKNIRTFKREILFRVQEIIGGYVMDNGQTEYICDDRPMKSCPEVNNMTDSELEEEFAKRFGDVQNNA